MTGMRGRLFLQQAMFLIISDIKVFKTEKTQELTLSAGRIPMKFRTDGLIIKEQNIGEQDKLVYVLTKSNGVIKAFVKGAKNVKNQK